MVVCGRSGTSCPELEPTTRAHALLDRWRTLYPKAQRSRLNVPIRSPLACEEDQRRQRADAPRSPKRSTFGDMRAAFAAGGGTEVDGPAAAGANPEAGLGLDCGGSGILARWPRAPVLQQRHIGRVELRRRRFRVRRRGARGSEPGVGTGTILPHSGHFPAGGCILVVHLDLEPAPARAGEPNESVRSGHAGNDPANPDLRPHFGHTIRSDPSSGTSKIWPQRQVAFMTPFRTSKFRGCSTQFRRLGLRRRASKRKQAASAADNPSGKQTSNRLSLA